MLGSETAKMRRFPLIAVATAVLIASMSLVAPRPVHAELNGPCEAEATISAPEGGEYENLHPTAKTGIYTVPIAGSAAYAGSISVNPPPEGRTVSGRVGIVLPMGNAFTLKSWSDPDATKTADSGTVSWDLPAATPRGIEMTVSGTHTDMESCSGAITVRLEGGLTDSATGLASLAVTAVAGLGVLMASTGKRWEGIER